MIDQLRRCPAAFSVLLRSVRPRFAQVMDRTAASQLLRVAWRTAGQITGLARVLGRNGSLLTRTTNEAAGEVWTATGRITQYDFATYVNSGI